jgi:hypothetical protein
MAIYNSQEKTKRFENCVLETREINKRDDSDFYAIVWDEARQMVRKEFYATTRCATYHISCSVDMTQEMLIEAEANAEANPNEFKKLRDKYSMMVEPINLNIENQKDIRALSKGDIVKNRFATEDDKVYEIFWIGADKFNEKRSRVGIRNVEDKKDKMFVPYGEILKEVGGEFIPVYFKALSVKNYGQVNYEDISKSEEPTFEEKFHTPDPCDFDNRPIDFFLNRAFNSRYGRRY